MKIIKFTYSLIIIALFISCTNENQNPEPLSVGIWKPTKLVEVCENNEQFETFSNACIGESRLSIYENGNFNLIWKNINNNGNCTIWNEGNGTWDIFNDTFRLHYINDINEEEIEIFDFFEITSSILRIGLYDSEPTSTCNNPVYFYTQYERVE